MKAKELIELLEQENLEKVDSIEPSDEEDEEKLEDDEESIEAAAAEEDEEEEEEVEEEEAAAEEEVTGEAIKTEIEKALVKYLSQPESFCEALRIERDTIDRYFDPEDASTYTVKDEEEKKIVSQIKESLNFAHDSMSRLVK